MTVLWDTFTSSLVSPWLGDVSILALNSWVPTQLSIQCLQLTGAGICGRGRHCFLEPRIFLCLFFGVAIGVLSAASQQCSIIRVVTVRAPPSFFLVFFWLGRVSWFRFSALVSALGPGRMPSAALPRHRAVASTAGATDGLAARRAAVHVETLAQRFRGTE